MPRTVASEALSLCLQALILKFNKCGDFHILMIDRRSLHNREWKTKELLDFDPGRLTREKRIVPGLEKNVYVVKVVKSI